MSASQDTAQHSRFPGLIPALQSIGIYLATLAIAMGVLWRFLTVPKSSILMLGSQQSYSPLTFLLLFAGGTLVAFILIKFIPRSRFWHFFFVLSVFTGIFVVTSTLFPDWLALIWAVGFLWIRSRYPFVGVHNAIMIVTVAGLARIFGVQFPPEQMLLIIVVLAVYDVIAVYGSKHMVEMAKTLFQRDAFFGYVLTQRISEWKKSVTAVRSEGRATVLGAGDVAFPLFFVTSEWLYRGNTAFWLSAGCTVVGMILVHVALTLIRKPIPALVPLAASCVAAHYIVLAVV